MRARDGAASPALTRAGQGVGPSNEFVEFRKQDLKQSVPDRFEQQARRTPDRLAIRDRGHDLSYAALNDAANRIAHAILARCGEGEAPVALLFQHSALVVAAILGTAGDPGAVSAARPVSDRAGAAGLLRGPHR